MCQIPQKSDTQNETENRGLRERQVGSDFFDFLNNRVFLISSIANRNTDTSTGLGRSRLENPVL